LIDWSYSLNEMEQTSCAARLSGGWTFEAADLSPPDGSDGWVVGSVNKSLVNVEERKTNPLSLS
jgi:hypothetical protein